MDAQYIRSSVRGTVASLKVKAGDVVTAGQEVAVVRDDSTLLLTLDFPAADAASYSVGQSVDVTIDGTFESTTGTIQSISGADSLSSGNLAVRSVVIAVPNPGTLNTAMSGTASINGVSAMGSAHFYLPV
ncbi:MAG: HlyD family efflux transporter periplasmic adaptor subunit [Faecalibacterium sp.]